LWSLLYDYISSNIYVSILQQAILQQYLFIKLFIKDFFWDCKCIYNYKSITYVFLQYNNMYVWYPTSYEIHVITFNCTPAFFGNNAQSGTYLRSKNNGCHSSIQMLLKTSLSVFYPHFKSFRLYFRRTIE